MMRALALDVLVAYKRPIGDFALVLLSRSMMDAVTFPMLRRVDILEGCGVPFLGILTALDTLVVDRFSLLSGLREATAFAGSFLGILGCFSRMSLFHEMLLGQRHPEMARSQRKPELVGP